MNALVAVQKTRNLQGRCLSPDMVLDQFGVQPKHFPNLFKITKGNSVTMTKEWHRMREMLRKANTVRFQRLLGI